eukprot:9503771-Pyramimonas_sp.AAC.1
MERLLSAMLPPASSATSPSPGASRPPRAVLAQGSATSAMHSHSAPPPQPLRLWFGPGPREAEEFVQRFFEAQQDFNLVSCELLLPPGSVGFVVEMNGAGLAWLMDAFPVFIAVSSQAARGGRAVTIAIGGPRAYVPSAVREAVAWLLAGPRVAAAPASSAFPRRLGGGLPESPVDLASTQEYGSPPDVVSGLAAERAEEAADGLSPTQPVGPARPLL